MNASAPKMTLDALLAGLRAAGEATRLRLIALLAQGELTVKEITEILGQSQPRVSRHLKLLVEAGLVDRFREGSWAFYRVTDRPAANAFANTLTALCEDDDAGLMRDRERLAAVRARREEAALAYFRAHALEWDRLRALHVDEALVEEAMIEAFHSVREQEGAPAEAPSMIDLGTGTGRILQLFGPHIERGIGLDGSRDMLNVARANLGRAGLDHCQVRQGDLYRLGFDEGTFDFAMLYQVLHFLEDPVGAIREACRVLKPGGHLMIVDFAPHELEFLREQHKHRRLGFASAEVEGWLEAGGTPLVRQRDLAPGRGREEKLIVSLWIARRAAEKTASARRDLATSQGKAA